MFSFAHWHAANGIKSHKIVSYNGPTSTGILSSTKNAEFGKRFLHFATEPAKNSHPTHRVFLPVFLAYRTSLSACRMRRRVEKSLAKGSRSGKEKRLAKLPAPGGADKVCESVASGDKRPKWCATPKSTRGDLVRSVAALMPCSLTHITQAV
jgi:hypothetical protein